MPANAEQQEPVQRERDTKTLDVLSLMNLVSWELPQGEIVVRGIVHALRPHPNWENPVCIYGDLRDPSSQAVMSFRCSPGAGITPTLRGEPVILRGKLQVSISRQGRGFKVELAGTRLGSWAPEARPTPAAFLLPPERVKVSLAQLLAQHPAKRLILLGTSTGIGDASRSLAGGAGPQPVTRVVSMQLAALQAAVAEVAPAHSAICLLRGGGEASRFAVFDDPLLIHSLLAAGIPFYTAIGHATDLTLADKHADQSFITPTDFGSAYVIACKLRDGQETLKRSLADARLDLQKLQSSRRAEFKDARQTALDGNIAILAAVANRLQNFEKALPKASRLDGWMGLLALFLSGVLAGCLGFYGVEQGRIGRLGEQLEDIQRQIAPTSMPARVQPPAPHKTRSR